MTAMQRGQAFRASCKITVSAIVALLAAAIVGVYPAIAAEQPLGVASLEVKAQSDSMAALTKAKAAFGVADGNVMEATSLEQLTSALQTAQSEASAKSPYIVHVSSGTIKSPVRINIPTNVVLVSEKGVVYQYTGASNDSFIMVAGSLYGGAFDGGGNGKASSVVRFAYNGAFTGVNGIVQSATVRNGAKNGICIRESGCKNAVIKDCVVTKNYENGITIEKDAQCKLISNTKSTNNGRMVNGSGEGSGINISHSNVAAIQKCTLSNNKDKGISTNSDPISGYKQAGCIIGSVTDSTISNNFVNGVYLKPKCSINKFTGNTVSGNGDGLVCAGKTAAKTTGNSVVKNASNNTFKNNKRGQVVAQDKGATIYLVSKNIITAGKGSGVLASKSLASTGGVIRITGSSNVISNNKLAGVSVNGGGQLVISGKNNSIKGNATQGIYCNSGKVMISGAKNQVTGNKKMGIAAYAKSVITISGATTAIKSNKSTGVYVVAGSKLTVTGKGFTIQGATDMGLLANKSNVVLKGANLSILSSKNAGVGLYNRAKLTVSGKGGKIQKNGTFGIYAKDKATATVKNTKLDGNNKGESYVTGGAKVSVK